MVSPFLLSVELVSAMGVDGGGRRGAGGVDSEEVTRHEIKCLQYLSLMEKCDHVLSAPVFPLLV